MKNKLRFAIIALTLTALVGIVPLASGCGKSKDDVAVNAEDLSDLDKKIYDLEQKLAEGNFTQKDYMTLAALYDEANLKLDERNLLEQCYRMYFDDESLARLNEIAVNVDEESEAVKSLCESMWNQMASDATYGSLMNQLLSSDVFATLMPSMTEGSRTYYETGKNTMVIKVGYEGNTPYITAYKYLSASEVLAVNCMGNQAQVYTVGCVNGTFSGSLDLWTLSLDSGCVMHETGAMVSGLLEGDYEANICYLSAEALADASLESLWNGRDSYGYTHYAGTFASGAPQVSQPDASVIGRLVEGTNFASALVYAYTDDANNVLWLGQNEEAVAVSAKTLMMMDLPVVNQYTPGEHFVVASDDTSKSSKSNNDQKVRVYDGMIQMYNGATWETIGSVSELSASDPFTNDKVATRRAEKKTENTEVASANSRVSNRNSTSIAVAETPTVSDTSTTTNTSSNSKKKNKSGNNNSGSTSNETPSGESSASTSSGSDSAPSSSSGSNSGSSGSSGSGNSGGSTSEEPEIEWSEDMM